MLLLDTMRHEVPVFVATIAATVIVAYIYNRFVVRLIRNSSLVMRNDPTNYKFLRHATTGIIYIVGFSIAVQEFDPLRTVAKSLLAGAGILAVAVGFASQHALSNVISGIFLVLFKPFRVNDRLRIKDTLSGTVEDITLRHTVIRDFENRRIVIPNDVMNKEIIVNADLQDGKICKWVEIPVGFDSNLFLAKNLIADEVRRHPFYVDVRTLEEVAEGKPVVQVRVIRLTDHALIVRAWAWAEDADNAFVMGCDLLESIKIRFDREGIPFPYPARNVTVKNDASFVG